jgi:integrase
MLRDFLASCGKAHLHELERRDLIDCVAFLKTKERGKRLKGLSDRTVYNKFELLMSFLKAKGIRGLATRRDWPKYTEQDVEVYEREELTELFQRCEERERVLFKFFLSSAGRDREVIFTAWTNLDLKNSLWHVKAKPNLGFKPKDYEERTVPLPDSIVEELKRWRKHAGNDFLVFPGLDGKPDTHMLRTLKQLALDACLNCGHCKNAEGLSCRKHPVCDRWYLHKFRATAATNWLQNDVDIKTVQAWLGHSDMESTLRYLKAASARKPIVREKVNTAFAGLTT